MELILLVALFQIKHYWADFAIQTYQQTVRKGIYRDPVGLSHSLDHAVFTLIVLLVFNFFVYVPPLVMVVIALLESLVHYHIDFVKVKFGCKDTTRPVFWHQFGIDQLAHQLTYVAIYWYLLPI